MKYNTFKYSLKVWLTSVVVAPFFAWIIMSLKNGMGLSDLWDTLQSGLCVYFAFAAFGFIFSMVTWIVFWIIISAATLYILKPALRQWLISIAGILLTLATFMIFFEPDIYQGGSIFLILMLCNCGCIGWGTWFYKLKPAERNRSII